MYVLGLGQMLRVCSYINIGYKLLLDQVLQFFKRALICFEKYPIWAEKWNWVGSECIMLWAVISNDGLGIRIHDLTKMILELLC